MSAAIEIENLTKVFKTGSLAKPRKIVALDRINLTIREGEIFALLGPNGAGKTTLLKILSTLVLPDAGTVSIGGRDLLKEPQAARTSLSFMIADGRGFYARLTGRQNLIFFATLYGLSRAETGGKIKKVAARLALEDLDKPFQEYSSGMKQRLAIARSFLNEAKFLLMDEPTKSLDPLAASQLRKIIREMAGDAAKTFLFTTHNLEEASQLAGRMGILHHGKLTGVGNLETLRNQLQNPKADAEWIFEAFSGGN